MKNPLNKESELRFLFSALRLIRINYQRSPRGACEYFFSSLSHVWKTFILLKYLLSRKLATRLSSYIPSGRNFAPSIFRSPVFPGITGPSPPWSGGLGLWASGMALSSGASGTTGFALGTAGEKKHITVRQSVSHWRDRMPGITTTCRGLYFIIF